MEFFFFPDVYADRELIDFYIITFKLKDKGSVRTLMWEDKEYIVEVLDWQAFKNSAYDIVLYEFGDEVARYSDIETALSEAYKMAYISAQRLEPNDIVPAMGVGNPPVDVIKRVFPKPFRLDPFPQDLESYLDNLVRSVELKVTEDEEPTDDEEFPF